MAIIPDFALWEIEAAMRMLGSASGEDLTLYIHPDGAEFIADCLARRLTIEAQIGECDFFRVDVVFDESVEYWRLERTVDL